MFALSHFYDEIDRRKAQQNQHLQQYLLRLLKGMNSTCLDVAMPYYTDDDRDGHRRNAEISDYFPPYKLLYHVSSFLIKT